MHTITEDPRGLLLQRVRADLQRAEAKAERLRRMNLRLILATLAASALATLLAGVTAATGPVVGAGPMAWRWTCGVIALVTGFSGLMTSVQQRFNIADHLAQSLACTGRLRALELSLTLQQRDARELVRDYEEVVANHPSVLS